LTVKEQQDGNWSASMVLLAHNKRWHTPSSAVGPPRRLAFSCGFAVMPTSGLVLTRYMVAAFGFLPLTSRQQNGVWARRLDAVPSGSNSARGPGATFNVACRIQSCLLGRKNSKSTQGLFCQSAWTSVQASLPHMAICLGGVPSEGHCCAGMVDVLSSGMGDWIT